MSKLFRETTSPKIGKLAERNARQFLESQGLVFIAENIRYKFGEIDLIMCEQNKIIFVEVKYRRSERFGGPVFALSKAQSQRLMKAAQKWLQQYDPNNQFSCRFDMVALSGNLSSIKQQWIKNIFQ